MVITDELSKDTTLLQLRCKMGLRLGMLLNREKNKNKNKARINSSFVETTIYRVIFNISQKEKKEQNK